MLGGIGMPELIIILVIALLIFGPSRLPALGKSFGRTLTSFRKGLGEGSAEGPRTDEEREREQLERDIRASDEEDGKGGVEDGSRRRA